MYDEIAFRTGRCIGGDVYRELKTAMIRSCLKIRHGKKLDHALRERSEME